jgi:BirA family biotin operon repressor/biotin-[acetyl-CoA-carboxylase] ligase
MIHRIHLEEVDSTNKYASQNRKSLELPVFISTDYQNEGRGQGENSWISEREKNLLLSWVFKPFELDASISFYISKVMAIAISDLLETYLNNIFIKWPNDILAGNRKIAGILIENTISGAYVERSIAGMGININQEEFPEFTDGPDATSLFLETGSNNELELLLEDFIEIIKRWSMELDMHNFELIDQHYYNRLYLYEEWGLFRSSVGIFEGKVIGVEKDGHLQVSGRDGKIMKFAFKEIQYLSL